MLEKSLLKSKFVHSGRKLEIWLSQNAVKKTDYARFLGISKGYLSGICRNRYLPAKKLAKKIEDSTQGAVTFSRFKQCKKCGEIFDKRDVCFDYV